MVTQTHSPWSARLATLVLAALAGAGAVYWALKLSAGAPQAAPAAPAAEPLRADASAMARLLGAGVALAPRPQAQAQSSGMQLLGVLASTDGGSGAALIAAGGQPAKPFRVGAVVGDGLVLQSLDRRQARLGASVDGPTTQTLLVPLK